MQSLEHQALAYFRSKPADDTYEYGDVFNCAMCQFLRDAGYPVQSVGGISWFDTNLKGHPLPPTLGGAGKALVSRPRTFGALADRLEKALSA